MTKQDHGAISGNDPLASSRERGIDLSGSTARQERIVMRLLLILVLPTVNASLPASIRTVWD